MDSVLNRITLPRALAGIALSAIAFAVAANLVSDQAHMAASTEQTDD